MEQTLTTGQISITIDGHLNAQQTRDGSWIVQVPPTGARITSRIASGMMLNVRGDNTTDIHTNQVQLPADVKPTDAVVLMKTGSGRGSYWDVPGRSVVSESMAVVFVSYPLFPNLLRPPAVGTGPVASFLRSSPIPESMVNVGKLPSVIDKSQLGINWSSWGAAEPTISYLTNLLWPFAGDCYDGWSTDTRTPDQQHPGYGSYYASIVSQALVQLCTTEPVNNKTRLAMAVVQRGLDLAGAFSDRRVNYPLGGHSQGRKALIVAAGYLLGVEPFQNPTNYAGKVFQEDTCYEPSNWWFGTWDAGWKYTSSNGNAILSRPPAEWGDADSTTHNSFAWMFKGYLPQVAGSQVGTALAMRLMGCKYGMGLDFDKMIAQWMRGPSEQAKAELATAKIIVPWGTDYALSKGAGFCAEAWKKYAN